LGIVKTPFNFVLSTRPAIIGAELLSTFRFIPAVTHLDSPLNLLLSQSNMHAQIRHDDGEKRRPESQLRCSAALGAAHEQFLWEPPQHYN
jgi:hypothetical protein